MKKFITVKIRKYLPAMSEWEKEAKFKLIKKQLKNAKSYKDSPCLDMVLSMYEQKRALERFIKEKFEVENIDYDFLTK